MGAGASRKVVNLEGKTTEQARTEAEQQVTEMLSGIVILPTTLGLLLYKNTCKERGLPTRTPHTAPQRHSVLGVSGTMYLKSTAFVVLTLREWLSATCHSLYC